MKKIIIILLILFPALTSSKSADKETFTLENEFVRLTISNKGETELFDKKQFYEISFLNENPSSYLARKQDLSIDNKAYNFDVMQPVNIEQTDNTVQFNYLKDGVQIQLIYELSKEWRFFSKQLKIEFPDEKEHKINSLGLLQNYIDKTNLEAIPFSDARYGLSCRIGQDDESKKESKSFACFMTVQNPFSTYEVKNNDIYIGYKPEMKWNPQDGPFLSDRLCIGFADLTGNTLRTDLLPEWEYIEDPDAFVKAGKQTDLGEIQALTECMRHFLLYHPDQSVRVHIGWCENDYQIDVSTPEGNKEYKRILDQALDVGSQYVLYTPANNAVAPLDESRDAWGWENVLLYNMGQQFRKGEWKPGDPLPPSVQDIVDYAKSKGIGLLAYVYPSMPFMQDSSWTAWRTSNGHTPGGYTTVDTGLKSYQDWLVDNLIAFADATGCQGFSFDHWWIAYESHPTDTGVQVSSKYQQWYGCRRILEQLREKAPHLVIDGRQQYHHFGTWTWLAGTYPHPMMSDEQPGSFNAFPDLSTDRVSADRQRYVAYRLMTRDFVPMEIMPGYMTHQTQRSDAEGHMHRDRFRPRDWDYLGWKYNILSSIATAPFNHVIDYIPARSIQEFVAFSEKDKAFFNFWLDFTDENISYMRNVKPIIGQPMAGRCDGTSAIIGDNGYIFIFNPNYRHVPADFTLDQSIGLTEGEKFILKEIYPQVKNAGPGVMNFGEKVQLSMPGITAKVFKIEAVNNIDRPVLINVSGEAKLDAKTLYLSNVIGEIGSSKEITVLLPSNKKIKKLIVNGKKHSFNQDGNSIKAELNFEGNYFPMAKSLIPYNSKFQGTVVEASLTIPARIFQQLEERKKAWPVEYTEDDKIAPWLAPSRLLLYVRIAEPYRQREEEVERDGRKVLLTRHDPIRKAEYRVEIDGKEYELNEAYNGVYPNVERTNLGIFVDISGLKPELEYTVKVKLPGNLKPGQFEGLFIENVVDEYTGLIK